MFAHRGRARLGNGIVEDAEAREDGDHLRHTGAHCLPVRVHEVGVGCLERSLWRIIRACLMDVVEDVDEGAQEGADLRDDFPGGGQNAKVELVAEGSERSAHEVAWDLLLEQVEEDGSRRRASSPSMEGRDTQRHRAQLHCRRRWGATSG